MKSILTFIFNVARNISLVLVILFFCLAYYFEKHPEQAEKWLCETSEEVLYPQVEETEADFISVQSFEIPESNRSAKKLTIPIRGGSAYLRPSQIMYVDEDTLLTTTQQKIFISCSVNQLFSKLEESGEKYFYKTSKSIINCHYVIQFASRNETNNEAAYNYRFYAKMENGKEISVPREKSKEFFNFLDALLEL